MNSETNPQEKTEIDNENDPHKIWLKEQIQILAKSPKPSRTVIYKLLKPLLEPLGYWREKPRGKGFEPGKDDRRAMLTKANKKPTD